MSKQKFMPYTSPAGVAKFPKLNTPDTKFKAEGEYSVKLLIEAAEAQPLIDKIDGEIQKAFDAEVERLKADGKGAKAKSLKMADKPYKADMDEDGNETGKVSFTFKSKASYVDKKTQETKKLAPPNLFDGKGQALKDRPEVWGGSILRVAGEIVPFATAIGVGASLRMNAVKILELRSGSDRTADSYGFGGEEGEYSAPEATEAATSTDDAADDTPNF